MNIDKLSSRQASDAAFLIGQPLALRKDESRFLSAQAAIAKTAMRQTLHDLKETLKEMVNENSTVKQHPLLVTGSAVVVGFVTGAALSPARRKQLKKPWPNSVEELQRDRPVQAEAEPRTSFLFSTLGAVLMGILKLSIQKFLSGPAVVTDRTDARSYGNSDGPTAPGIATE